MMELMILSQQQAEEMAPLLNIKTSIISITSPDDEDVKFQYNKNIDKIFRMKFHDIITDMKIEPFIKAPRQEDFAGLKDFVDSLDCDLLIVHCAAGQSRSAAVGAAINEYLNLGYKIFGDTRFCPNHTVYKCCMKEFKIEKDRTYYEDLFTMHDKAMEYLDVPIDFR